MQPLSLETAGALAPGQGVSRRLTFGLVSVAGATLGGIGGIGAQEGGDTVSLDLTDKIQTERADLDSAIAIQNDLRATPSAPADQLQYWRTRIITDQQNVTTLNTALEAAQARWEQTHPVPAYAGVGVAVGALAATAVMALGLGVRRLYRGPGKHRRPWFHAEPRPSTWELTVNLQHSEGA